MLPGVIRGVDDGWVRRRIRRALLSLLILVGKFKEHKGGCTKLHPARTSSHLSELNFCNRVIVIILLSVVHMTNKKFMVLLTLLLLAPLVSGRKWKCGIG